MLEQSDVDAYAESGCLVVPNVFTLQEIAELNQVTDEFVDASRDVTEYTDVFDLEPGHTPDEPRLRRIKTPPKQHPVYDASLRHKRVLDMVAQLIGRTIHWNGSKLNMKAAGYGSPVEWHQDWAFYPHTNDDLLAVGIALHDATRDSGCLMVIPGSHRGPVYDPPPRRHVRGRHHGPRLRAERRRAGRAGGGQRLNPPRAPAPRLGAQRVGTTAAPVAPSILRRRRMAPDRPPHRLGRLRGELPPRRAGTAAPFGGRAGATAIADGAPPRLDLRDSDAAAQPTLRARGRCAMTQARRRVPDFRCSDLRGGR